MSQTTFSESPQKILVRATNWIGDGVMMTPALSVVRRSFPDAEIVVAANPLVAQLFIEHPCCDRILVYDKRGEYSGFFGLRRFVETVKKE